MENPMEGSLSSTGEQRSTAERVRELAAQGWKTSDIARRLGIRYQHAYNALRRPAGKPARPTEARARVSEGGRIVIPAAFREALDLHEGDEVVLHLKLEEGGLHVLTPARAVREAQRLVRQYVPEGRSLADELIAERRGDAARE